jgi:hypothetical protein
MSTKEEASVMMEINADNEQHLYMMATHLKNVLQADYYTIGE